MLVCAKYVSIYIQVAENQDDQHTDYMGIGHPSQKSTISNEAQQINDHIKRTRVSRYGTTQESKNMSGQSTEPHIQ